MEAESSKARIEGHSEIDLKSILESAAHMFPLIFGGAFTGIALSLAASQLNGTARAITGLLGGFLIGWAAKDRNFFISAIIGILSLAGIIGAVVAIRGLAGMATGGIYGPDHTAGIYLNVQNDLIAGVLWLLLGVPSRAFNFHLDRDGKGTLRDTMTGFLSFATTILTSTYIIVLHYGGGPFEQFDLHALIVGDIFTVLLLPPIFHSIAASCWQRGLIGSLSLKPIAVRWTKAGTELDAAWTKFNEEKFSKEYAEYRKYCDSISPNPLTQDEDYHRRHLPGKRADSNKALPNEKTTPKAAGAVEEVALTSNPTRKVGNKMTHQEGRSPTFNRNSNQRRRRRR